jgi:hypothetical protein
MPEPTERHLRLRELAGEWEGEETMFPSDWDPKGGKAKGRTSARVALGSFVVISDYEQVRDGNVTFAGHGVWTIEPASGLYAMYWFDSIGLGMETFRGTWEDDVISLVSQNPMGRFRLTYDLSAADVLRSRMESSQDGESWVPMFEGTYRRTG